MPKYQIIAFLIVTTYTPNLNYNVASATRTQCPCLPYQSHIAIATRTLCQYPSPCPPAQQSNISRSIPPQCLFFVALATLYRGYSIIQFDVTDTFGNAFAENFNRINRSMNFVGNYQLSKNGTNRKWY